MPKWREENQEKAVTRMPREMASGLGDTEVVGNLRETSYFRMEGRSQGIKNRSGSGGCVYRRLFPKASPHGGGGDTATCVTT